MGCANRDSNKIIQKIYGWPAKRIIPEGENVNFMANQRNTPKKLKVNVKRDNSKLYIVCRDCNY